MSGWELFARYAFPPNELGYCGPPDASVLLRDRPDVSDHARGFDGAWPYLEEIAAAAGADDPLDIDVVANYWIGGQLLDKVDPVRLLRRIQSEFASQPTGLLDRLRTADHHTPLAHHSFHVCVVYPWARFLDTDPTTPLRILQACRIRWGTVEAVIGDDVQLSSRPLRFDDGHLSLGAPVVDTVHWRKDGIALAQQPSPGDTVTAHWDWMCDTLDEHGADALTSATRATIDLVNDLRGT